MFVTLAISRFRLCPLVDRYSWIAFLIASFLLLGGAEHNVSKLIRSGGQRGLEQISKLLYAIAEAVVVVVKSRLLLSADGD